MNVIDDYKRVHGIEQPQYQGETKLYDFAKEIVKQQKAISEDKIKEDINKISNSLLSCYYLLLINPDLRQYVFMVVPEFEVEEAGSMQATIEAELYGILKARGEIIDIDMTNHEKKVWEFWIKDKFDKQIRMYQLCDYTEQTIVFGEGY